MADEKKELSAADVAAKLKSAKVRVHKMAKGQLARDEAGNFLTIERAPTAADIISFAEAADGSITAITCDGQKLTA